MEELSQPVSARVSIDLELDEIGPERVIHYHDPAIGLRAVLVIDVAGLGASAGGVRAAGDLSVREVARLARAMSYKFAMLELPVGGAKAGIWVAHDDPARPRILEAFVSAIRPLAESGRYLPGADLGTSAEDFASLRGDAGAIHRMGREQAGGAPLEEQLTGFGVVVAARTACLQRDRSLCGATVALEGFGKVGTGAARAFAREGAIVQAVSTVHGAIHDPKGLDLDELLALREKLGDRLVDAYPRGERIARDALFELPVDVLVPGARPDAIHGKNVEKLRARLIVPAANIPYAEGMAERLHARGVVALPDFVTNAGGVLSGIAALRGLSAEESFALVEEKIAAGVRTLFEAMRGDGGPYRVATGLAHEGVLACKRAAAAGRDDPGGS